MLVLSSGKESQGIEEVLFPQPSTRIYSTNNLYNQLLLEEVLVLEICQNPIPACTTIHINSILGLDSDCKLYKKDKAYVYEKCKQLYC